MPQDRVTALKSILAQNPADALARYGLAMEYVKSGDFETALAEFRDLTALKPDHAYAFFQTGQALEKLGRIEEAKDAYRLGIEAASRKGDAHARDELRTALEALG